MNRERQIEDYDQGPERDQHGRFRKGTSGNPRGRPPNPVAKAKTLANCVAEGLLREVAVNDNGTSRNLTVRELLVEKLLRAAMQAKPKELTQILLQLEKVAADAIPEQVDLQPTYTEEDHRLVEDTSRWLDENYYCKCEKPIRRDRPGQTR